MKKEKLTSCLSMLAMASALIFFSSDAQAQHSAEFNAGYMVNIPAGAFRDQVNQAAFRGFTAGVAYPVNEQLSIGLQLAHNDYYQKYPRQQYTLDQGTTVSAVLTNSIQQLPVMAALTYSLYKKGVVLPYIGAGAGVNFISFDQYLGEFDNPQSAIKPVFQTDAGVLIPLSKYAGTAIRVGGSYQWAPFHQLGTASLNSWGLMASFRFRLR